MVGANINRRTVENCRRAGLLVDSIEELTPGGLVIRLELSPAPESLTEKTLAARP
jgi:hypothetical protein